MKPKKEKDEPLFLSVNHLSRFSAVAITTLSIVAVFVGIGYGVDRWLGTKPWFLVIGVVLSFPVNQIALYRKMKSFGQKAIQRKATKSSP